MQPPNLAVLVSSKHTLKAQFDFVNTMRRLAVTKLTDRLHRRSGSVYRLSIFPPLLDAPQCYYFMANVLCEPMGGSKRRRQRLRRHLAHHARIIQSLGVSYVM